MREYLEEKKMIFKQIIICSILLLFGNELTAQQSVYQAEIDSLLHLVSTTKNDTLKVLNLKMAGQRYFNIDIDSAAHYLKKAIKLDKEKNVDGANRAMALILLSKIEIDQNSDLELANQYLDEAYNFSLENKLFRPLATSITIKSTLLVQQYKSEEAIKLIEEGIVHIKGTEGESISPYLYMNLSDIFKKDKNFNIAKQMLDKALVSSIKNAPSEDYSTRLKASITYNKSILYYDQNILDSAEIILKESLSISRQLNDYYSVCQKIVGLTNILIKNDKIEEAKILLEEGEDLIEKVRLYSLLPSFHQNYQALYHKQKNFDKCIKSGKKALNSNPKMITLDIKSNVFNLQCECLAKSGKVSESLMFKDSLIAINTEINDLDRIALTKEKEAKYLVTEMKNEQIIQENALKRSQLFNWGIGFLMICIGGLAFLFYRLYKQRQVFSEKLAHTNLELEEKNTELTLLDTSKNRFFANVSHELKTPLTLIISPIRRLLSQSEISNEDYYLMKSVEKNSLHLLGLTNQILELNKFELNKVALNESSFNFSDIVYKTYADFESLAKNRKIDYQIHFEGNRDLIIEMDSYKLQAILKNLISNAIKFTNDNGKITIEVTENENSLNLSVSDTGQGIHEKDLPFVFNRYYQAKIVTKFVEGGTGIGLSICNEYTKLLGGELSVKSEFGKGSKFSLSLPKQVSTESITFISDEVEKKQPILQKADLNNDLPQILVVEDNADMQTYLNLVLSASFNVTIANHGKEALEILAEKSDNIQLIISDIMMPMMNGYELIENLKSHPKYLNIPVIMLTALSDSINKLKALRIGIDDYVVKPFVDEELLARIDNLIENVSQRQAYKESLTDNLDNANNDSLTTKEAIVPELSIKDLEFIKNVETIVLENYKNTNFNANFLAMDLNLSRAQVFRKIKSTIGTTPKQYIDQVRYHQAKLLLENNIHYTIKAVALSVGFKDEKYFSRNFKKRFGKYPSEYND